MTPQRRDALRLLISGSRVASKAMLNTAYKAVERAKGNGWQIVVGDAEGVDYQALYACCWLNVDFEFFGISIVPRHYCCLSHINRYRKVSGDYLARDRHMVALADRGFFLWNGRSHGTMYTYNYMQKSGKPCDLRTFVEPGAERA